MNIVIINGSHRKNGNNYRFCREAKEILNKKHNVELYDLIEMNIEPCRGCLCCEDGEACPINDDFSNKIKNSMMKADLIIFATPTYFNMPSPTLVELLARTNCLCEFFAENQKKVITHITGQADEESMAQAYGCLQAYYEIMNMEEEIDALTRIVRMPEKVTEDELKFLKSI